MEGMNSERARDGCVQEVEAIEELEGCCDRGRGIRDIGNENEMTLIQSARCKILTE